MTWTKYVIWATAPLTLLLFGLLLAAWRAWRKDRWLGAGLLALCLLTVVAASPFSARLLLRQLSAGLTPPPPEARADWGVVLGGMLSAPSRPGAPPEFHPTISRAIAAAELFEEHRIQRILVLGGNQPGSSAQRPEAEVVRDFLIDLGVPANRIVIDTASTNTRENARNSAPLLASHPGSAWLVTNAWHMRRALREFQCAGVAVTPFPVGRQQPLRELSAPLLLPSAEGLMKTSLAVKEWMGLIMTIWRCDDEAARVPERD